MAGAASLDLIFRRAAIAGHSQPVDIGIADGRVAAIAPRLACEAMDVDAAGRVVLPGFVDSHVHLDKACLPGCCDHGLGLAGAIAAVSGLKRGFTEADVYRRGARVIEKAIGKGTTRMRTHVEVDPRAGLRSFAAIKALKADYAWGLDLQICVFPQEGLTNDPGTEELLIAALRDGADLLGGCPYTDSHPAAQIERLFALARRFDVDLDLHLDFDLDPGWMHLDEVCRQTLRHGWGGRVAIGHVTKLSMVPPERLATIARRLADAGIAVTVLPATDLYLMGRQETHAKPRGLAPAHRLAEQGVVCSIATNNVLNPFTPFGDGSLLRMAQFYANVAQCGPHDFGPCLDLVTTSPARLMRLGDYGLAIGHPADLVVLDAATPGDALAEIAEPVMGFKRGRLSFERPPVRLNIPGARTPPRLSR